VHKNALSTAEAGVVPVLSICTLSRSAHSHTRADASGWQGHFSKVKSDEEGGASAQVLGSPWKFQAHGECGTEVSELLLNLARVVDDIVVVRPMQTAVNDRSESRFTPSIQVAFNAVVRCSAVGSRTVWVRSRMNCRSTSQGSICSACPLQVFSIGPMDVFLCTFKER
jgi:hypothetical protein